MSDVEPKSTEGLRAAEEKMRAAGQHPEAIRAFRSAYERLVGGDSGMLPSADLEPAGDVPKLADLPAVDTGDALGRVALVKLNGGLATSMGLRAPKSLVEVHDGKSFMDIIVAQAAALRERYGIQMPLVLMNSPATEKQTLAALSDEDVQHFLQSMVPKLDAETLAPANWPPDPALEWAPPGHGDVYGALRRSGILDSLLEHGIDYAMISNADNLGATLDPRIPAYLEAEDVPFLMEVVEGTEADRKGGHIARRRADRQLVLRETAQTPEEDEESFRDYRRWRYYNTNNLWVDLRVLAHELQQRDGVLELPLIINRKTVDPRDSSSTDVIQLESAMGAAIASFSGARILCVPRTRFAPVKTTDDLLVLRSDAYAVADDCAVKPTVERLPYVELDPRYYKLLDEFESRFPGGPPSLREAERLVVQGDVTFGRGVVIKGAVELDTDGAERIADGTVLAD